MKAVPHGVILASVVLVLVLSGCPGVNPDYCGDGVCKAPENSQSCSRDCGPPVPRPQQQDTAAPAQPPALPLAEQQKTQAATQREFKLMVTEEPKRYSALGASGIRLPVEHSTADGTETYYIGDTIAGVTGINKYEGRKLSLKLKKVYEDTGRPNNYFCEFELYDPDGKLVDLSFCATQFDLRETFYENPALDETSDFFFITSLRPTKIGKNASGEPFVELARKENPGTPFISKVSPIASGAPGSRFTLSGQNLTATGNTIKFGEKTYTNMLTDSTGKIGATVPAGTKTGIHEVTVTNLNGKSNTIYFRVRESQQGANEAPKFSLEMIEITVEADKLPVEPEAGAQVLNLLNFVSDDCCSADRSKLASELIFGLNQAASQALSCRMNTHYVVCSKKSAVATGSALMDVTAIDKGGANGKTKVKVTATGKAAPGANTPPVLSDFAPITINKDSFDPSKPVLDLWSYVTDDSAKSEIKFSFGFVPGQVIDCTANDNRNLTCSKPTGTGTATIKIAALDKQNAISGLKDLVIKVEGTQTPQQPGTDGTPATGSTAKTLSFAKNDDDIAAKLRQQEKIAIAGELRIGQRNSSLNTVEVAGDNMPLRTLSVGNTFEMQDTATTKLYTLKFVGNFVSTTDPNNITARFELTEKQ